ncbi:MAG TPA: hypothetical protein VI260_11535 [Blastocatellia bacterium]|jgi:hypothetical protein
MQFGTFDDPHRHQPYELPRRPLKAVRSFLRWAGKLFRNPLAIVLLIWGFLLILSVTLVYAQDAGNPVNQPLSAVNPHTRSERMVCDRKTEVVEIFSVGEDLVIPPPPAAVKASSRRRTVAVGRRARR